LLDRISDAPLSPGEIAGMGLVFAQVMDEIAATVGRDALGTRSEIWRKAAELTAKGSVGDFLNLVELGASLNWLARTVRIYARPSGPNSDDNWINGANRDRAVSAIIARFRQLGAEAIFYKAEPLDILYCWLSFGDAADVRAFIGQAITSDKLFLDALSAMRNWVNSSEKGVYYPLAKNIIADFMDADEARARLERLALEGDEDSPLRERAKGLLALLEGFDSATGP
jgi:hypothetical protein